MLIKPIPHVQVKSDRHRPNLFFHIPPPGCRSIAPNSPSSSYVGRLVTHPDGRRRQREKAATGRTPRGGSRAKRYHILGTHTAAGTSINLAPSNVYVTDNPRSPTAVEPPGEVGSRCQAGLEHVTVNDTVLTPSIPRLVRGWRPETDPLHLAVSRSSRRFHLSLRVGSQPPKHCSRAVAQTRTRDSMWDGPRGTRRVGVTL